LSVFSHLSEVAGIGLQDELVMIENPRKSAFVGLSGYRCHLKSQTIYPQHKDDPNNVLCMSWEFHQRFDGLNVIHGYMVPQITIKYIGCAFESENVGAGVRAGVPRDRVKVFVSIESPEDWVLNVLIDGMKTGSSFKEIDNVRKIVSFVYVEYSEEFQYFLTFKYNETKAVWKKKRMGETMIETEAHTLRVESREKAERFTPNVPDLNAALGSTRSETAGLRSKALKVVVGDVDAVLCLHRE
jgi:hypothetical protein